MTGRARRAARRAVRRLLGRAVERPWRPAAGLPPRPDRVLLAASSTLADVLAPEWRQRNVDAADPPADEELARADLVLVEWSGGSGTGHPVDAGAIRALIGRSVRAGTPVVVWDTVTTPEPPGLDVDDDVAIRVAHPARVERYAPRPVEVLGPTFQQRRCGPGSTAGAHTPVVVRHEPGTPEPITDLLRAAASGAAVVTDRPEAAAVLPGVLLATGPDELRWTVAALRKHEELRARQATVSTRAALADWSASARADAILRAAGRSGRAVPTVSAVVPTMRPGQLDHVLDFVAAQRHPAVQLVLVTHGFESRASDLAGRAARRGLTEAVTVPAESSITLGACMNLGVQAADGAYVAKMDDDNHYGPHYLTDLLSAFEHTDAQVVGKWAHLVHLRGTGATLLRFPDAEHSYRPLVQGGTMVMPRDVAVEVGFEDLPRRVDTTFLAKVAAAGGLTYSADRFGFVSVRSADAQAHTWRISDLELLAKPSRLLFYGDPAPYADV